MNKAARFLAWMRRLPQLAFWPFNRRREEALRMRLLRDKIASRRTWRGDLERRLTALEAKMPDIEGASRLVWEAQRWMHLPILAQQAGREARRIRHLEERLGISEQEVDQLMMIGPAPPPGG